MGQRVSILGALLIVTVTASSGCFRLMGDEVDAGLEAVRKSDADGRTDGTSADGAFDGGPESDGAPDAVETWDVDGLIDVDADGLIDAEDLSDAQPPDADDRSDADVLPDVVEPPDADDLSCADVLPDADDFPDADVLPDADEDIRVYPGPLEGGVLAGGGHTCVVFDSGDLRCWGVGDHGELGYGDHEDIGDDELPSSVGTVSVGGTVTQLDAGFWHTCALLDTAEVRCWGDGEYGRLGYRNSMDIGDNELPSSVGPVSVGGPVIEIGIGGHHSCVLLEGGEVRCWGWGYFGQLGYGDMENIGDNEVPSSVGTVSVGGTVVHIAAGGFHNCVLLEAGDIVCWGYGSKGRLGYGDTRTVGDTEVPSSVGIVDVGGPVVQVVAGGDHTCVMFETGEIRCWGSGEFGQLGYRGTEDRGDDEVPSSVGTVSIGGRAVQIAAGGYHTCALLETGDLRCWGMGEYGVLGQGSVENVGDDELPSSLDVVSLGGPIRELAAGQLHTCALLENGDLHCWGMGQNGRLGYGDVLNVGDDELPLEVGAVSYR